MMDDIKQKAYADQITAVVEGFVQVWIKFEAMLYDELARTQHGLEGTQPESEPRSYTNYDLFYRVSSSMRGKDNVTMGELSSALSVPLSTATRMVDWLVSSGYAQRLPDAEDRRIVRVALTDSGRELRRTIERYTSERVQQILSCLTPEEQAMLFSCIRKVVAALKGIA
jgi:DNA-binding MarR family transcriptional regulator